MAKGVGRTEPGAREPAAPPEPATARMVLAAIAVGTLTGLVGVGGGFLIVPALAGVLGWPMSEATATSLAVIALNTGAASAGWFGRASLDLPLTVPVTVAALVGMGIGTRSRRVSRSANLTRAFAVLLLVVGAFMLARNCDVRSEPEPSPRIWGSCACSSADSTMTVSPKPPT